MKITNDHGLPDIFYRAIIEREKRYTNKSLVSPSSMTEPIRAIILKRRHWDELSRDCSGMLWSMFGSAVHSVVAEHGNGELVEEYLECEVDVDGEMEKFGGTLDLYENETIEDFKVTSAWTIVYGSRIKDWELQLNSYRYLLEITRGLPVNHMRIWAMLRDWSRSKAQKDPDYPQADIIPVEIKPVGVHDFLVDKIRNLRLAEEMDDEALPYCTAEERWAMPDKWALMKEGRKSAVKVYDDEESANMALNSSSDKHYIEFREGKSNRCVEYCPAFPFCNQAEQEFNGGV